MLLQASCEDNVNAIRKALHESDDLLVHDVLLPTITGKLLFLDTITDAKLIHAHVLDPISRNTDRPVLERITAREVHTRERMDEVLEDLIMAMRCCSCPARGTPYPSRLNRIFSGRWMSPITRKSSAARMTASSRT
ncbi:hypothetical protein [Paenibacillus montanisoli]|uniref:hypothetical protein n=1 Tax=Paenibacillus montanisoli TaxID=2081970 RepID=UPI001F0C7EBB|nr:hypothetical protein [Paenibacillus montanisoli]